MPQISVTNIKYRGPVESLKHNSVLLGVYLDILSLGKEIEQLRRYSEILKSMATSTAPNPYEAICCGDKRVDVSGTIPLPHIASRLKGVDVD